MPHTDGEPLRGRAAASEPVLLEVEVSRGVVCVHLRVALSRPETHLAIVRRTFQEAGWDIALDKVQLGFSLNLLGLGISAEGEGALYVQKGEKAVAVD